MADELRTRVQSRLEQLGVGAVAAATAAGLERTYIRDIVTGKKKTVSVDKLPLLARALNTTVEYLTLATTDPTAGSGGFLSAASEAQKTASEGLVPNVDLSKAEDAPPLRMFGGPRNVPVLGTAVGGGDDDGDFRFNGETIDYAPRPPGIALKKDVYVLYVENDSMFPKYEPGERLYVDPHRKPRVGDYTVIELYGAEEGEAGKGFIKRLVKQTTTKVVVSQFNPPKELEFDRDQVKSLHRVIPQDELLGV